MLLQFIVAVVASPWAPGSAVYFRCTLV